MRAQDDLKPTPGSYFGGMKRGNTNTRQGIHALVALRLYRTVIMRRQAYVLHRSNRRKPKHSSILRTPTPRFVLTVQTNSQLLLPHLVTANRGVGRQRQTKQAGAEAERLDVKLNVMFEILSTEWRTAKAKR